MYECCVRCLWVDFCKFCEDFNLEFPFINFCLEPDISILVGSDERAEISVFLAEWEVKVVRGENVFYELLESGGRNDDGFLG